MATNPMQAAFARLEAHRRELEMQIVLDLQKKFLAADEKVRDIVASHDGSHLQVRFDTEDTDSANDSHITITWIDED